MEIIKTILKAIAFIIADPYCMFMFFLMGVVLFISNRKIVAVQKLVVGKAINNSLELTASQLVLGIFGGALFSIILTYLGVTFNDNSVVIVLLILMAITLFVNNKYLSIVYTGAVVGIVSIISRVLIDKFNITVLAPLDMSIVSLIALIGSLYIVQGILISIDGSRGAIPIFANKENKIIGGFALKRQWLLPLALLVFYTLGTAGAQTGDLVEMPKWWPILQGTYPAKIVQGAILMLLPLYTVAGINSVTFTKSKRGKCIHTGVLNIAYGSILIVLASVSRFGIVLEVVSVILMVVFHEVMLYFDNGLEVKGEPKYVSSDEGLMILEIAPSSPAEKMGLKSGDLILDANGKNLAMETDIFKAIKELPSDLVLKIKDAKGNIKDIFYSRTTEEKVMGIVFVPRTVPNEKFMFKGKKEDFSDIINKLSNYKKDK